MNEFEPEHIDEAQLRLPPELVRELKSLHAPPVVVPSEVDDRLLAEAEAWLQQPRLEKRLVAFPKWLSWAAAAALVVGVSAYLLVSHRSPGDLNRDGRCDVLDAFSLARRLQQGGAQDPALDINGDGLVDQHDVETLLARAVRLKKEKGHG